jgi:hypothetical protein
MCHDIIYRRLEEKDNPVIAALIRTILKEFHIDRPGTAYTDPTTDDLFSLFAEPHFSDKRFIPGLCGAGKILCFTRTKGPWDR